MISSDQERGGDENFGRGDEKSFQMLVDRRQPERGQGDNEEDADDQPAEDAAAETGGEYFSCLLFQEKRPVGFS